MKGKHLKVLSFLILLLFFFPASSFAEKIVVIDPGHGGKFSGTTGYSGNSSGFYEKHANLLVGLKVRQILQNTDIKVLMTRDNDSAFSSGSASDDLIARMNVANGLVTNNNNNSLFISIHHNASPSSLGVQGIETYYYDGENHYKSDYPPDPMQMENLSESKRLAEIIHPKLIGNLGSRDLGIRNNQSLYVIRRAQMPAVLLELGYMTNRYEEARIKTADFQQRAAQAIANAAIEFFKVFEVHNENGKILKTFKTQQEADNYAKQLSYTAKVFDKDKQTYLYTNDNFEVYHSSLGFLKAFPTQQSAIDYANGYQYTRVISKENNTTIWSNYLDRKYDTYINNQFIGSYFDFEVSYNLVQGKQNSKIVNSKTNEVVWSNIPEVPTNGDISLNTVSGSNRLETAIKISQNLYPNGFPQEKQEKTVILTTGYDFADALSAGPLTGLYDKAPILLTPANGLDEAAKQEIVRLGATKVVMIGGKVALSQNVEDALKSMNLEVERISGTTRYETNLKILEKLGNINGLFVAYGGNFPDALSVAPIAANKNWGILLVQKDQVAPLQSINLQNNEIVIAGGTGVISNQIQQQLKSYYPGSKITRLAGENRYETNLKILKHFQSSLQSSKLILTTGKDFPDALAAAPLSIGTNAPLILIGDQLERSMESYLFEYGSKNNIVTVETIGGVVSNQSSQTVANKLK